jgi:ABC-type branched-subunit amino acid transport system substrate-binding protein
VCAMHASKSALLAMTIWAEDVNAKGGLLGRQVKLVHYDDQSNPANVRSGATRGPCIVKAASQLGWCGAASVRLVIVTLKISFYS